MASINPAEWAAVTAWEGTVLVEHLFAGPGSTTATMTLQGTLRLRLDNSSGPAWKGTLDYSAAFSSASGQGSEQGSATGTLEAQVNFGRPQVIVSWPPVVVPTTATSLDGTTVAGVQVVFPLVPSKLPTRFPDAIGPVSDSFETVDASNGLSITRRENWALVPTEVATFRTFKVWVNAFIPRDQPGVTLPVLAGPHAGETMLADPFSINDCFLTNQRTFDTSIVASSRIHSEIEVNMFTGEPVLGSPFSRCFPTVEVDCATGNVEEVAVGSVKGVGAHPILTLDRQGPGAPTLTITLFGAASNPAFLMSPDITYSLIVTVAVNLDRATGTVTVEGETTQYPAFEVYIAPNGGTTIPAFQRNPAPGATPRNLLGPSLPVPPKVLNVAWFP